MRAARTGLRASDHARSRWFTIAAAGAVCVIPSNRAPARAPDYVVLRPAPAPGPLDNPLKGWCTYTYRKPNQPYSMVFRYVPWRELEPRQDDYEFAAWERKTWMEPAARGKFIVLRLYVDYPGKPTGMPPWLIAAGVRMRRYTDYGGGSSPDYDDPRMVSAMLRLIAALGRRYDGNPRVAFVEMGLLGFWGEWHTYPRMELFASPQTQQAVLQAAHRAFPHKVVMTRYASGYAGTQSWLGYFDDDYPADTDGSQDWCFQSRMRATGRTGNWMRAAVGGEMEPGLAPIWMGDRFDRTLAMAVSSHFSWIGPYNPALTEPASTGYMQHCRELVRRMGYEYVLREIRMPRTARRGDNLSVSVTGVNRGTAPFYYPWQVQLALLDDACRVRQTIPISCDLRNWLPGAFGFHVAAEVRAPAGSYTLALGIRDPWKNRPDIGFANALPFRSGWTLLGRIQITPR